MWEKLKCSQEFAVLLLTQWFYILPTYFDQFSGRAIQRLMIYEQLKRDSFPPCNGDFWLRFQKWNNQSRKFDPKWTKCVQFSKSVTSSAFVSLVYPYCIMIWSLTGESEILYLWACARLPLNFCTTVPGWTSTLKKYLLTMAYRLL